MLTKSHRQEALSRAYVHAVAARCGYSCSFRDYDYGIDLTVHEIAEQNGRLRETAVRLDIQIKSTTAALTTDSHVAYDLEVRDYDNLRAASWTWPRILVLLVLPGEERDWAEQSEDGLTLRRCAYWASLMGMPPTPNAATVRVTIPRCDLFSPHALRHLIETVRTEG